MQKNVAGQVIGAQMVSATTGAAFTGTVTVSVTGDGGSQATGSVGNGLCTHEGNGYHTYAPAQAETNYTLVAFTFTGTGAVPVTIQVFTSMGVNGFTTTAKAEIQTEAEDALTARGVTAALFSGITSLAQWLGLIAGKQTGNTTARTELRATGAGSGTYDETTDSNEAIKDSIAAGVLTTSQAAQLSQTHTRVHSTAIVSVNPTSTLADGSPLEIVVGDEYSSDTPWGAPYILVSSSYTVTSWTASLKIYAVEDPSTAVVTATGTAFYTGTATQQFQAPLTAANTNLLTMGTKYRYQWQFDTNGSDQPYTPASGEVILLRDRI